LPPAYNLKPWQKGGGTWNRNSEVNKNTTQGESQFPEKNLLPLYYENLFLTQKIIIFITPKLAKTIVCDDSPELI
jgi:hypothetical protein